MSESGFGWLLALAPRGAPAAVSSLRRAPAADAAVRTLPCGERTLPAASACLDVRTATPPNCRRGSSPARRPTP